MAEEIEIIENEALLRQIVAEKGYYAYKNRHTEILLALLKSVRTYEELSDEGKIILQAQMNLGEEQIKQLSHLLYPPSEFGDDVSPAIPNPKHCKIQITFHAGVNIWIPDKSPPNKSHCVRKHDTI